MRKVRQKKGDTPRANVINIQSTKLLEILCIDFISLERSKSGFENILVILIILPDMQWQCQKEINLLKRQLRLYLDTSFVTIVFLKGYIRISGDILKVK